jgi:hypothetical protein
LSSSKTKWRKEAYAWAWEVELFITNSNKTGRVRSKLQMLLYSSHLQRITFIKSETSKCLQIQTNIPQIENLEREDIFYLLKILFIPPAFHNP